MFQQDPGNYNPNFNATKQAGSKWGFGSEKRQGPVQNRDAAKIPGAGTYKIPSKLSEGPKYGISAKLPSEIDASPAKANPGPGNYDLQNRDNINMRHS